ncbi:MULTISPECIES: SpoIIE family protein phosphatase [Kitasatospora]|uniref:SpoIIE family protein phosphatase n=1 Tax=Kitasatospora TaxID=2063 RepID=UPI000C712980|nr:SpoIIE family protein phosphatase [Kitasatospora sp. GP30]MDH6142842.1 serine phosphatase RsbU (regulator of sigma subunit)/PAS domain-containing protein [Kitasatospora sp. GP30]
MRQDTPVGGERARRTGPGPGGVDRSRAELVTGCLRKAVLSTEAYGCLLYLASADRRSLQLSAVAGVPASLLSGFARLPVPAAHPVPAAFRSGRTVTLGGPEETMRRFPELLMGLPYAFASVSVPVIGAGQTFGALFALWPTATHGVPATARRHLRTLANRLGAGLAALAEQGEPQTADGEPLLVDLPEPAGVATSVGLFDWDLAADVFDADDSARAILQLPPDRESTWADLADRVHPSDLAALHAAVRPLWATPGHRPGPLAMRLRLTPAEPDGRAGEVRLWARPATGAPDHLVGVVSPAVGSAAAGAVERLPQGVFALDPDGWLSYLNRAGELLLGAGRGELLGRQPWEALPWLADPGYPDRYRAAMLSQTAVSFLACRPPEHWLAFSLYPDAHGVTGTVVPAAAPARSAGPGRPVAVAGRPPAMPTEPGAIYHLMQLASLLTQAVTVREVCATVAEQILPAFGGQQLALYVVRENRLHLALQTGYPDGFLDRFEGIDLRARLPGVDALISGSPIFYETAEELAAAYPGIPLDDRAAWAFLPLIASGRPVGSCILGFQEVRRFTAEERGVLTALGGLIAQALERARLYDTEFALARGLQHALLPHRLPPFPGLAVAARYLPGTSGMEIGGDWYDVLTTGPGLTLVIGDVEGHSVAAAATMGQLRSVVRAFTSSSDRPQDVLARTNQLLMELDPGLLASCLLVRLDPGDGPALMVRAGHVPPLLRHPDGRTEVLELPGGPLLGVATPADFPAVPVSLPVGSVLALYTDGLVEEPGIGVDPGIARLRDTLAEADPTNLELLADRLLSAAHRSPNRPDDVALLLARREPDPPA